MATRKTASGTEMVARAAAARQQHVNLAHVRASDRLQKVQERAIEHAGAIDARSKVRDLAAAQDEASMQYAATKRRETLQVFVSLERTPLPEVYRAKQQAYHDALEQ